MSGIGGVVEFGAGELSSEIKAYLGNIEALSAWRGSDSVVHLRSEPAAMFCRSFDTVTRAVPQSLQSPSLMLTLDGRVDNLADLTDELRLNKNANDVEVIEAAYIRWNIGCFDHLVGDFAVAIWDAVKKELFLARDPFGVRPLCFSQSNNKVYWASTADAVLFGTGDCTDIDRHYVAEFLMNLHSGSRSPFRRVRTVPPGHYISICQDQTRQTRYWRIHDHALPECSYNDNECEEEFRRLLFRSVQRRLRSDNPVVAELSGGA